MTHLEFVTEKSKEINKFTDEKLNELKDSLQEINVKTFSDNQFSSYTFDIMRKKYNEALNFVNTISVPKNMLINIGGISFNHPDDLVYFSLQSEVSKRYKEFDTLYHECLERYASEHKQES